MKKIDQKKRNERTDQVEEKVEELKKIITKPGTEFTDIVYHLSLVQLEMAITLAKCEILATRRMPTSHSSFVEYLKEQSNFLFKTTDTLIDMRIEDIFKNIWDAIPDGFLKKLRGEDGGQNS